MLEAEQSVINCILLDNNSIHNILHFLRPEDFSTASYRDLFKHAIELSSLSKPIDTTTLVSKGVSIKALIDCQDRVPTASNIKHYAGIVKETAQRRNLLNVSGRLKELAQSTAPVDECICEAEKEVLSIRKGEVSSRTMSAGDLGDEILSLVKHRMDEGAGFFGKRTGLKPLDHILCGLQKGEVTVLAGRPSMGKSSVATQILLNTALDGHSCLLFSLEMSHQMCGMRMLSQLSGIGMSKIKSGNITQSMFKQLEESKSRLKELKIWVDDTGAIPIREIRSTARRIYSQNGLDLVVVDYLQLCGGGGKDGRERDVAEVSAGLKAIAKEFDIPVIMLSQLNRSCETREDKRPHLADLRESGAIEQDADAVVMVYRHAVYDKDADHSDIELIVRKNRNGPLGTANVYWNPECMSVRD